MAKYHISAAGNPALCRASVRPCPLGPPEEHYGSAEEARAAFESAQAPFSKPEKKVKESEGVSLYRSIMEARARADEAYARRNAWYAEHREPGAKPPQAILDACAEARREVRELERELTALPWTADDGPSYSDEPLDFFTPPARRGRVRKGYENDLSKLTPREEEAYEALDAASEVWLSRLSTAEVKALHAYVQDAQSYAESMAESHGTAATFVNSFKYLHSALEKAPRAKQAVTVYAGLSGPRVLETREAAEAGEFTMNRVQSTSLNPAMVNNFMRPSDYDLEDHTALEIKTDRVASLTLFHLREEMEILLPPQSYRVLTVESNVSYAYPDGYTYEPAERVYRLAPKQD